MHLFVKQLLVDFQTMRVHFSEAVIRDGQKPWVSLYLACSKQYTFSGKLDICDAETIK
jgi:hypothetical protein